MNIFEKIVGKAESIVNPEQHNFDIIQTAQIELIQRAGGDDIAGTWIDVNSALFRELINDSRFNYIERLGNEDTHDSAIEEIEQKLTPLNNPQHGTNIH